MPAASVVSSSVVSSSVVSTVSAPPALVLGIDVSKGSLACALWDRSRDQFTWNRDVPNTDAGVDRLLKLTPEEASWVMEPTGRYSLFVAQRASQAGRQVLLAPTRQAKHYLNSLQTRAKTDRVDSQGLALFAAARPATKPLHPYPINPETVEQLNQLLTARKGVVDAIAALTQRLEQLPYAAQSLQKAIEGLKLQLREMDQQIKKLSHTSFPEVKKLQKVPGIGPVTAAAVASRLKSRHFSDSDKFVGYIGLDVKVETSGTLKGKMRLSKQGDAELRRLLFLSARSSLNCKTEAALPFQEQYQRELAKGMTKTAATCALARKLARLCWSMVHNGTEYNPERVSSKSPQSSNPSKSSKPPLSSPPGQTEPSLPLN